MPSLRPGPGHACPDKSVPPRWLIPVLTAPRARPPNTGGDSKSRTSRPSARSEARTNDLEVRLHDGDNRAEEGPRAQPSAA